MILFLLYTQKCLLLYWYKIWWFVNKIYFKNYRLKFIKINIHNFFHLGLHLNFVNMSLGGVTILGQSLVIRSNAANTVSHSGIISMVMQHFGGTNSRSDASTAIAAASTTKKLQQASLENNLSLINYAPFGTIR